MKIFLSCLLTVLITIPISGLFWKNYYRQFDYYDKYTNLVYKMENLIDKNVHNQIELMKCTVELNTIKNRLGKDYI